MTLSTLVTEEKTCKCIYVPEAVWPVCSTFGCWTRLRNSTLRHFLLLVFTHAILKIKYSTWLPSH